MANRYWVGGNGTWDTTTTTNWSATSGGAGGASAPTSADNVFFNSNSGAAPVVTISSAVCANLTISAPTSGILTLAFGSSTLQTNGDVSITTTISVTGTGTINHNSPVYASTFAGNGNTFYNINFTSIYPSVVTITGANTFNNFTITTQSYYANGAVKKYLLGANQTINGTLNLGTANTVVNRTNIWSTVAGVQRTITLNGTLATMTDCDFRDIVAAGTAGTWSGTRIGNCTNNSNITFTPAKTVYWNLAGTQYWNATAWATTNNGVPAANNFPLAQDTAVFTEAGACGTVNMYDAGQYGGLGYNVGNIQMADGISNRTTAITFAFGTYAWLNVFGNLTCFSNLTVSGLYGGFAFSGIGVTQQFKSAGVSIAPTIHMDTATGSLQLQDNLTSTNTSSNTGPGGARAFDLISGTFDLNNYTFTTPGLFRSDYDLTRVIAFGTSGKIVLSGNNKALWYVTGTTITYSGTSRIECTYSGSTGTRLMFLNTGADPGFTEANAASFYVTGGTDIVQFRGSIGGSPQVYKTIDLTGFAGTFNSAILKLYGDFVAPPGVTFVGSTAQTTFAKTSGIQKITTGGNTLDFPLIFNGVDGTFEFQDALTQGSTKATTLINGTLKFKSGTTNVVGSFVTSGTTQKYLQSTVAGSQATLSQASGKVNATYLTVKDIATAGSATWFATTKSVTQGNNSGWCFTPQLGKPIPSFAF